MRSIFLDAQPALNQFGRSHGFPDNYFVFDFETSGFSREFDVITQLAWTIVRDRRVVDTQSMVLNWPRHPYISQSWLRGQLLKLAESYAEQGKVYRLTYDVLEESPYMPVDALSVFDTLLDSVIEDKEWLIGHNIAIFDTEMMDAHRIRFLGKEPIDWPEDRIFDTGLFLKAAQLGRYPRPGESLDSFFRSISGVRAKGVFWAMDTYCIPAFGLEERHGIDTSRCHDAGYDCHVNHLLFEAMREVGESTG